MKAKPIRSISWVLLVVAATMLVSFAALLVGCGGSNVQATDYKDAFKKGNEAYKQAEWSTAEAYYRLAEQMHKEETTVSKSSSSKSSSKSSSSKSSSSSSSSSSENTYSYEPAANNLGLALLQQNKREKTAEAYEIYKNLVVNASFDSLEQDK